jgi:mono/diheme cytochrome c family protein
MRSVLPFYLRIAALGAAIALPPLPALSEDALSPAAQRGFVLMRTHCVRCHSLDKVTDSPLKAAPPFRTLHERYPVESLEESLAEGIITGHPTMPEFRSSVDPPSPRRRHPSECWNEYRVSRICSARFPAFSRAESNRCVSPILC